MIITHIPLLSNKNLNYVKGSKRLLEWLYVYACHVYVPPVDGGDVVLVLI